LKDVAKEKEEEGQRSSFVYNKQPESEINDSDIAEEPNNHT